MRAADGLLLGVLDDDPTGLQAVHGVQVVTVLEEDADQAAFGAAPVCFVLTNTRSLASRRRPAQYAGRRRGLIAVAAQRGAREPLSRSDSTLRGHVMAEVAALQAVRRQVLGSGFDGVLLIPAFLEASLYRCRHPLGSHRPGPGPGRPDRIRRGIPRSATPHQT